MRHAHLLLSILLVACGGADGTECTEGETRCQARRFTNICRDGAWAVEQDCATMQASCVMDGGAATCQAGADSDTDTDADTDTDTDTYVEIDTSTLSENCATDADCLAALGDGHCCSLSVFNGGGTLCAPESSIYCRSTVGRTCPDRTFDQCIGKDSQWCIWRWDTGTGENWTLCSINCTVDSECTAALGQGSCCTFMPEDDVGWVCYPAHSKDC